MLRSSTLATIYFAKARFCNLLSTNSLFLVPLDQDPILVGLGPQIETLQYLFYTTKMLFILYIITFTIHYISTNSLFLVPLDQDPILVGLEPQIETLQYLFYTTKMLFILYITTFTIHYISCITFFILLRVILKFSFFFPFLSPIIHGQSIKSSFTYGINCNNVIDMR